MTRERIGFARCDLFVIAGMVAMLAGLAAPALARLQEAECRVRCENNLRRLGVAINQYADANQDQLPYCHRFKTPLSGWATLLLPYLAHEDLYRRYNWELDWVNPANQALAKTPLDFMACPSTPNPGRLLTGELAETKYAVPPADYFATLGFTDMLIPDVFPPGTSKHGALPVDETRKRSEIPDGLATTLFLGEDAGRPQIWIKGKVEPVVPPNEKNTWAAWNGNYVRAYSPDGRTMGGPCAVNCSNNNCFYAFHPGGAFALVGDGSVRFLHEGLDAYIMYALVTREGGEVISPDDF